MKQCMKNRTGGAMSGFSQQTTYLYVISHKNVNIEKLNIKWEKDRLIFRHLIFCNVLISE
jgi:hypothetical protein